MSAWKWILGALTGGLSLLGNLGSKARIDIGNSAKGSNTGDGEFDKFFSDLYKEAVDARKNSNPSDPSFMSHQSTDYMDITNEGNGISDWIAGQTGSRLTSAQREANAFNRQERIAAQDFNHNEAVDARLWDQYVAQNKYQWETQSMEAAGVNPAMVYGGGSLVPTAAGSAQASASPVSSVSPGSPGDIISSLMALVRMPLELKSMKAEIDNAKAAAEEKRANAKAVADNAESNRLNAITNQMNSEIAKENNRIADYEAHTRRILAENDVRKTDAEVRKISADEAYTVAMTNKVDEHYEILMKHADAAQKSALAAIKQANAAWKNAETNAANGKEQRRLMRTQSIFNVLASKEKAMDLQFLPEKQRVAIEEARARGYYFNEQGQLCDRQGHFVDAQTAKVYTDIVCEVATTACNVAGTVATGGTGGVLVDGPKSTMYPQTGNQVGPYGTYGTYGDYESSITN